MSEINRWSTSPTGALQNATGYFPEGQAPSTVNDAARTIMAELRRDWGARNSIQTATYATQGYSITYDREVTAAERAGIWAFIADQANHSASATLNINALGAKDLRKPSGHLDTSDIDAKQICVVAYNATGDYYELLSRTRYETPRLTGGNILAPHENLVLSRPTVATIDIDADAVLLTDTVGHQRRYASINETLNITVAGTNGLDTGAEAASTWYFIWAIGQSNGTLDGLLSTSSTAPTLPSGYTHRGLLGAAYNNGASDIVEFRQRGSRVWRTIFEVLGAGTASTLTAISLTEAVPALSVEVVGLVTAQAGSAGTQASVNLYPDDAETIGIQNFVWSDSATVDNSTQFALPLKDNQSMGYLVGAGDNADVAVTGWRFL